MDRILFYIHTVLIYDMSYVHLSPVWEILVINLDSR